MIAHTAYFLQQKRKNVKKITLKLCQAVSDFIHINRQKLACKRVAKSVYLKYASAIGLELV
jgi:hypothetical protein